MTWLTSSCVLCVDLVCRVGYRCGAMGVGLVLEVGTVASTILGSGSGKGLLTTLGSAGGNGLLSTLGSGCSLVGGALGIVLLGVFVVRWKMSASCFNASSCWFPTGANGVAGDGCCTAIIRSLAAAIATSVDER